LSLLITLAPLVLEKIVDYLKKIGNDRISYWEYRKWAMVNNNHFVKKYQTKLYAVWKVQVLECFITEQLISLDLSHQNDADVYRCIRFSFIHKLNIHHFF
jgi:hypothetical protein